MQQCIETHGTAGGHSTYAILLMGGKQRSHRAAVAEDQIGPEVPEAATSTQKDSLTTVRLFNIAGTAGKFACGDEGVSQ